MPRSLSRRRWSWVGAVVLAAGVLTSCGGDDDPGDERAEQVRTAAVDAGLEDDVADFLALAARGQTATYQATYPGPEAGTELVVASDPPDRRVDIVVDDRIVEARLVLDGEAFTCVPDDDEASTSCERTDAVVEAPGSFDADTLDELTESLLARTSDFTFRTESSPIAGVEARCLVTEIRVGRGRPELGALGTICVSDEGALLKVDRDGESLEATDYTTDVPDNTFVRPDREE